MTDRVLPADSAARDRIASALNETLFVEAGAGTGKTAALVKRMVALVASGVPVSGIAAITFTEAAAAELRDRVRGSLDAAAIDDRRHAGRYQSAIAGIDAAPIQTLHGFARRILALYPLEAGLPPYFEVRDEVQAAVAFDNEWSAFIAEVFDTEEPDARLIRGLALGLTAADFRTIAQAFHDNWDRIRVPDDELPPACEIAAVPLLCELESALGMQSSCTDPDDKLYQHLEKLKSSTRDLRPAIHALDSTGDEIARAVAEQDLLRLLHRAPKFTCGNDGQAKNWHGHKQTIQEALTAAAAAREELLSRARRESVEYIAPIIARWVLDYAERRRIAGSIEFHDLLIHVVRLLRTDTAVRQALHRRYTHLLIDEFQDTDPLQVELATLLATNCPEPGNRPWQELAVEPGRLFFVGDPRQSIYRFRRAEIELYEAARDAFAPEPVHLTANFRSQRAIIDWVNDLFGHLFANPYNVDGAGLPRQAPYTPLTPYRTGPAPSVRVIGSPMDGFAPEIHRAEATEIATLVLAAHDTNWLGQHDHNRTTRFEDITILIPTRTTLASLEAALDSAKVPFRIEGSTLLFDTAEVRDFINILGAIDDPTDEVAIVAALRSPAFACADDELYRFRQLRPRRTWDYTARLPEEVRDNDPVRLAMESLRGLHEQRSWLSLSELVETVIRERRLFELAFAHSRPRDTWQRLRFLHERARAFAADGSATLRQFIGWLTRQAEDGSRLSEGAVPDPEDDAVRIMTIHAAKGLEFPIVFVAGIDADPSSPARVLFHAGERALPEVHVGSEERGVFETGRYTELSGRERVMERLERDRLLYVAATRACEQLVVSAYHKTPGKAKTHLGRHTDAKCSLAECLHEACKKLPGLRGAPLVANMPLPFSESGPAPKPIDLAVRDAWLASRSALIAANQQPETIAATTVAHADDKREPGDDLPPWRRGRAGTSVGRAVHAVLQTVELATLAGLVDAARAQAAAEGIHDREAEVAALVRSAVESEPIQSAIASGRLWRELYVAAPVATPVGSMLLEGFVDLLYQSDEGFVVVDYKTDAIRTDADAEMAMSRYRLQGAAYALALQERLPGPVVRFDCIFVRQHAPARVRSISGTELQRAMHEVRTQLERQRDGEVVAASS